MDAPIAPPAPLGAAVREDAWELPTFVAEIRRALHQGGGPRLSHSLARIAHEHARFREELGYAPRDVVTEFLLLRRVLWRFLASDRVRTDGIDIFDVEYRLNNMIDRVIVECVAAYFDRATAELVDQARRDALTTLLNHQAFSDTLHAEVARAARYDRRLALVFFDIDRFKQVNDTLGHIEGDRVLRRVANVATATLRASDIAGRLGGDEFGALMLETDRHGGERFLSRFRQGLAQLRQRGDVPGDFDVSAGVAHYPDDATTPDGLLRIADQRQYASKRAKVVEEPREVVGQRRLDVDPFAGEGMREGELRGVQELPVETRLGHPVDSVTGDRQVDCREVDADLVHPPGLELHPK
jgi:diguanylate cyclase (GGDEF)-like protein